ncbi:mannose-1-phosphate guanylyltransferase/mannose-6-phosphate isomerase [Pseudomonas sp. RIT-PI-AD]|uniref:mannose-1-phosphate guanylyltransferase/mannose-6-phosphate isomerase n=1 Tax=Pseudomonas sp. RIT-PI-AD TaxID=3035294 RepID=UPI0021D8BD75|nr:mannose-1-phosphate guanylyltransferase/mannose-6-phosphate isomerase [Pseudomonas sp. RIT-PI-AD]
MIVPVILSGGAGTRLWPVSREGCPKPFLKMPDGQSLLQKTYQRAAQVSPRGDILTVTNRDYYFQSRDEFLAAQLPGHRGHFLLEPSGRNTAPAIAVAALAVRALHGAEAVMLVMPSDHLILDAAGFAQATREAAEVASRGFLVTFGIRPTAPETGFGYIECGESLDLGDASRVRRFVEKPNLETARDYLESGRYLWNSGMFCFTAGSLIRELEAHAPEILCQAQACLEASPVVESGPWLMQELDAECFAALPDISIDYALMERSEQVAVVPARFDWSDIGSWNAMRDLVEPDEQQNRVLGEAILIDTRNTYVHSQGRMVATVGIDNLIVVDTEDAVLVAHPDRVQDVKKVVQQLKCADHQAYRLHRTVSRPWGTYTVLEEGNGFKIKRIVVRPGASLSLQMHHHRSEHWVVVRGMARVVNGERDLYVNVNESTYIPAGHRHRLENPGLLELVMIEVQSGEYLGEDDIVRFDDQYGRVP